MLVRVAVAVCCSCADGVVRKRTPPGRAWRKTPEQHPGPGGGEGGRRLRGRRHRSEQDGRGLP
eukprot:3540770-Alexandrium_andersonii.AAC.1